MFQRPHTHTHTPAETTQTHDFSCTGQHYTLRMDSHSLTTATKTKNTTSFSAKSPTAVATRSSAKAKLWPPTRTQTTTIRHIPPSRREAAAISLQPTVNQGRALVKFSVGEGRTHFVRKEKKRKKFSCKWKKSKCVIIIESCKINNIRKWD